MKPFITYEELVYPQVDELARSLPWLLPLGQYSQHDLAEMGRRVFHDERFGVLPSIPYGWSDSLLPLPDAMLRRILDSLADVLAEDGWERIVMLTSRPLPHFQRFEQIQLVLPPQPSLQLRPVAVVPIGHTEQHGFHLSLNTDTVIADGLAQRLKGPLETLPAWPYGVSTHRRQYPGTLTLDPRLFEDLWVEVAQALTARGFDCVFLLNAHGGNHSFLVNSVKCCGDRMPEHFIFTTFLHTSFGESWRRVCQERQSLLMGHACELETSYMLALRPDCVHMDWAVDEIDFLTSPNYVMDWVESGALIANPPWSDDTLTGTYGAPNRASAERGLAWLDAAAQDLSVLAEEAWQQHQQRKLRRRALYRPEAWGPLWEDVQGRLPGRS